MCDLKKVLLTKRHAFQLSQKQTSRFLASIKLHIAAIKSFLRAISLKLEEFHFSPTVHPVLLIRIFFYNKYPPCSSRYQMKSFRQIPSGSHMMKSMMTIQSSAKLTINRINATANVFSFKGNAYCPAEEICNVSIVAR